METEKETIGHCPLYGGSVVKACEGYRCEYNISDNPSCVLNISGIIGNRKMGDGEVAELLEEHRILLDGFATEEGETFPTVLELVDSGAVNVRPAVGKCPHYGGDIRVESRAFNCSSYGNQGKPYSFAIWRNVDGHQITPAEATDIYEKGITASKLGVCRDDGSIYRKRLGPTPNRLQIVRV